MRERRRKLTKAGGESGGHDADAAINGVHGTPSTADSGNHHKQNEEISSRKRTADQISNPDNDGENTKSDNNQPTKSTTNIIIVPADLSAKDAKKFRKDARRTARAQDQSEDKIKFVIEGQEQLQEDDDNNQKKKKAKKNSPSFPRINDLLTQHAANQKLAAKLAKQTSMNDALPPSEKHRHIAIDCEMVGVGTDGKKSALARASAVDWDGTILLDAFVRVPERVTDFRTFVSGVRPKDIRVTNDAALDHEECRSKMEKLLQDKVLVGHALKNDLSALMLTHPREHTRDTAKYKPFMRATGRSGGKLRPRKLRDLVYEELGKRIQVEGEAHSSVDDARASMDLFKCVRGRWEKELAVGKKKKVGGGGSRGEK